MKEIKIFELFSGIGTTRMALDRTNISYKSLGYSDINTNSIKLYETIFNDINNWGDITKIKELPKDIEFLTHTSPCQDFSIAGIRKGGSQEDDTRSSLMWETVRLIETSKPKVVLWENVLGAIQGDDNIDNFNNYLRSMEQLGYKNTWEVLQGTDFNIPQIRRRVFVLSFLNEDDYIDLSYIKKITSTKKLKDVLEKDVDTKYFLTDEQLDKIDIKKEIVYLNKHSHEQDDRVYRTNRPTTAVCAKKQIKVLVPIDTKDKYKEAKKYSGIYLDRPHKKRGTVQHQKVQTLKTSAKDIGVVDGKYNVRYLTPREYWRLMGIDDDIFDKCKDVVSENALYFAAGNAIIVDVLEAIYNLIFKKETSNEYQIKLF